MEAGARVYQGKVIVTDGDEKVTIKCGKNIKMKINDIDCETFKIYEVTSKDKIECECEKTEGKRLVDIALSEDKMKAYVKISYVPEIQYKLKDRESFLNLAIAAEKGTSIEPPYFLADELKKELNAKKENNFDWLKDDKLFTDEHLNDPETTSTKLDSNDDDDDLMNMDF